MRQGERTGNMTSGSVLSGGVRWGVGVLVLEQALFEHKTQVGGSGWAGVLGVGGPAVGERACG